MKAWTRAIAASAVLPALAMPSVAAGEGDGSSFTIRPDYSHDDIYGVYDGLRKAGRPQFITTDLVLHTGHLLFDYSLRAIEIDRLYGLADGLTKAMVTRIQQMQRAREAVRYAQYYRDLADIEAYFCVPAKILDPDFQVPAHVRKRVERDLALMDKHEGFAISATLDSAEDFSQYVPRGHYTRNEQFQRYFKAMMWYGRRMYRVQESRPDCLPIPDHWSDKHLLAETRQMLLITRMLYRARIDGKPAIETWNRLYVPTTLFAGRTEDLNPMEVKALAEKVWPDGLDGSLAEEAKIRRFAAAAAKFSKPKVDSSGAGRKGFGFMAQRFTPDSYITQCLVTGADRPFGDGVPPHPLVYVGKRRPRPFTWGRNVNLTPPERRFMPRGLDVMAVFGCEEALAILEADGDTEYTGYHEMMAFLRKDVGAMMAQRREENLYYAWLHALQPMTKPVPPRPQGGSTIPTLEPVPQCLRSNQWLRKQLATALASWAELRHDTILYVKQSYTPRPRSAAPRPRVVGGYVEPQPEVFRRIGTMVEKMRTDLAALGVMPAGLEGNYREFAKLCRTLAVIAQGEVTGAPAMAAEATDQFLHTVASRLKAATVLPPELRKKVLSETDAKMALVADVHTDNNSLKVLEQGVGTPFLLEVRMKWRGGMTTLGGAVFSYYEFKQPMKDRLTDEAWQKMLADPAARPKLPAWYPAKQP